MGEMQAMTPQAQRDEWIERVTGNPETATLLRDAMACADATRHHEQHGDMDGKTCLLATCPVHYPKADAHREGQEDVLQKYRDVVARELGLDHFDSQHKHTVVQIIAALDKADFAVEHAPTPPPREQGDEYE